MPLPPPTVDELVATLQRSSLPTVVVEGEDDVAVYRWLEDHLGASSASILPCQGRATLLALYDRRSAFPDLRVAFLADRDMWLFTAIPGQYGGVIWTEGYSIENDLYSGSPVENLLSAKERPDHRRDLAALIEWFAFAVEQWRAGNSARVAAKLNELIPRGTSGLSRSFCRANGFKAPAQKTRDELTSNYQILVRGKSLFELLVRYLGVSSRRPNYSTDALYEIALKTTAAHRKMTRLVRDITTALAA